MKLGVHSATFVKDWSEDIKPYIKKCNEAFLTSTTLGIIPVIKIEDIIINKKEIGLITKTLMKKLEDYLNKQIYE